MSHAGTRLFIHVESTTLTIAHPIPLGTGEINSGANVGGGPEVFRDKIGTVLNYRTITGSGAITVSQVGDTVNVDATALTGDVVGLGIATDGGLAVYDGTTGKIIKEPTGPIDAGGEAVTNVGNVDGRDVSADGIAADNHIADVTTNPHATDVGNLGSGTLAELNTAITDATLDDSGDARTPTAHAASHSDGGTDEIDAANLGSGAAAAGSVLTASGAGAASCTANATTDESVSVTGADTTPGRLNDKVVAGTGLSAAVLNPAADEDLSLSVDYGTASGTAAQGDDSRILTQDENDAGQGTSGAPSAANRYVTNADPRNTDARAPTAHNTTHENGGLDEISVSGLSGVLADPQTPTTHAGTHAPLGGDPLSTTAPPQGIGAGNLEGTANAFARSDHDHTIRESGGQDLTMGAVAVGEVLKRVGTTIVGDTFVGSDEKAGVSANDTTPGFLADKLTAGTGIALVEVNDGGDEDLRIDGVALTASAPANVTKAAAAVGVATDTARSDHKHDVDTAAAVANPPNTANAEGSSTSLARADHTHALAAFGAASGTFCEGDDARLSDARTPTAHALGGAEHTADTLANLNLKVSDATLIDTTDSRLSDARTPTSHAASHQNGGGDEVSVAGLSGLLADNQNPVPATESVVGGAEIATQVETDTGTDDTRMVTPLKLATFAGSFPPNGAASGGLAGTYPSPTVNGLTSGVLTNDAAHGVRGGGTQHAVAIAGGADGFMTGVDKTKLDGVATGAEVNLTSQQETVTAQVITGDTAITDTLNNTPDSDGSVSLYLNGVFQKQGAGFDYSISGVTLTWLAGTGTAVDLAADDEIQVTYLS